jgi:hypothetical protein
MIGEQPDQTKVYALIKHYGEMDAEMSYYEVVAFSGIFKTLSQQQKSKLEQIRNQKVLPQGTYLYSDPIQWDIELECGFLLSDK